MHKFLKYFLFLLICLNVFYCVLIPTSAHEVYQGVALRMQDKNSSSKPLLHVHYKYMRNSGVPSYYYNSAIYAINSWDGFAGITDGGCNQLAPTNMNVSFRCSSSVWSDLAISSNTLAVTCIYDTKGLNLYNTSNLNKTSGKIEKSYIYMNPDDTIFRTGTSDTSIIKNRIKKTMVHELGHAMGLGHPDRTTYNPISSTTYSIMRQGFPDKKKTGLVPQNHERTDINNMY